MDSIERQELEEEQAAREDYLHEAYGREVDTMNAVDEDHQAHLAGAGRFVNTTLSEFSEVLRADKGWKQLRFGNEIVFEFPLRSRPGVIVKVYSGIESCGSGRGCGKDAIRVCAVYCDRGLVKSSRINRVPGWQDRLKAKVYEVIVLAKARA